MSLEGAISTESVKERLRNLEEYMPGANGTVRLFAKYLAERLGQEVTPRGFRDTADVALADLQQKRMIEGTRFSGRIDLQYADLAGGDFRYYDILGGSVPEIARATCPTDFADMVDQSYRVSRERVASGQLPTIFD